MEGITSSWLDNWRIPRYCNFFKFFIKKEYGELTLMIIGSCPRFKMYKSQNYDQSRQKKELSNTNLGLLNVSADDMSTIGWTEILEILSFIILIWTVCKWCCKKRKRNNDKAARKLGETIRTSQPRVETSAIPTAMSTMSAIPAVTFQQPG